MRTITALCLVVAIAAAVALSWAELPSITRQAQAVPEAMQGISPLDMHRQIDVKTLPIQEIDDLV
jgi:hypothetical protein